MPFPSVISMVNTNESNLATFLHKKIKPYIDSDYSGPGIALRMGVQICSSYYCSLFVFVSCVCRIMDPQGKQDPCRHSKIDINLFHSENPIVLRNQNYCMKISSNSRHNFQQQVDAVLTLADDQMRRLEANSSVPRAKKTRREISQIAVVS